VIYSVVICKHVQDYLAPCSAANNCSRRFWFRLPIILRVVCCSCSVIWLQLLIWLILPSVFDGPQMIQLYRLAPHHQRLGLALPILSSLVGWRGESQSLRRCRGHVSACVREPPMSNRDSCDANRWESSHCFTTPLSTIAARTELHARRESVAFPVARAKPFFRRFATIHPRRGWLSTELVKPRPASRVWKACHFDPEPRQQQDWFLSVCRVGEPILSRP
jgi:hypothetical protein